MLSVVTAPAAVLIRPDGYVAWAGELGDPGLADACRRPGATTVRPWRDRRRTVHRLLGPQPPLVPLAATVVGEAPRRRVAVQAQPPAKHARRSPRSRSRCYPRRVHSLGARRYRPVTGGDDESELSSVVLRAVLRDAAEESVMARAVAAGFLLLRPRRNGLIESASSSG